jgi:hypothetical protein
MTSSNIPPPPPEASYMMALRLVIGVGGFGAVLWAVNLPANDRADILPRLSLLNPELVNKPAKSDAPLEGLQPPVSQKPTAAK